MATIFSDQKLELSALLLAIVVGNLESPVEAIQSWEGRGHLWELHAFLHDLPFKEFLCSVTIGEAELQKHHFADVVEIFHIVCLHPGKCIHKNLEYFQMNPYQDSPPGHSSPPTYGETMEAIPPYGDACWQCNESEHTISLNKAINLDGLRTGLMNLMIHRAPEIDQLALSPSGLVRTMTTYVNSLGKQFVERVFGDKTKPQSDPLCRALVLQFYG